MPVPTVIDNQNSIVAKFIGTFKRFTNKEYGFNIWQDRYYDHIIRCEQDFYETCMKPVSILITILQNDVIKETLNVFKVLKRIKNQYPI